MARLVPLIALAAGAFFLMKRDRTEGLLGHGLKSGIHDVKVGETLVLKPIDGTVKPVSIVVTKASDEGDIPAAASEYMAVSTRRPEITFLKEGAYRVVITYELEHDIEPVEYAFNVSE